MNELKWHAVVCCSPETRVTEARAMLDKDNVDGMLLFDGGMVMGSVNRADLDREGVIGSQPVGPYGHGCVRSLSIDADVASTLEDMVRNRKPVLPVKDNGRIVGMVSVALLTAAMQR
jgi:CBS domain-containing protein